MKYLKLFEEWHKVVNPSGSGRTRWIDTIHDDPTSAKSYSSSLLLKKDYAEKEFDELKTMTGAPDWVIKEVLKDPNSPRFKRLEQMKVMMNNLQFLKDKEKELGELRCEYCNAGPLVIYDINPGKITPDKLDNPNYKFSKFNPKDGATADHREPKSRGGSKFDYKNLAVCCYKCNQKKKNMSYTEWINRIDNS
jgi:hypothetical protein